MYIYVCIYIYIYICIYIYIYIYIYNVTPERFRLFKRLDMSLSLSRNLDARALIPPLSGEVLQRLAFYTILVLVILYGVWHTKGRSRGSYTAQ